MLTGSKAESENSNLRVPRLYIIQQERFLVSKIKALLGREVSIDDVLAIESKVDNLTFYNQQTPEDQELLLQISTKSFIKSLTGQEQARAKRLKRVNDEDLDVYASNKTSQKDVLKGSSLKAHDKDKTNSDKDDSILEVINFESAASAFPLINISLSKVSDSKLESIRPKCDLQSSRSVMAQNLQQAQANQYDDISSADPHRNNSISYTRHRHRGHQITLFEELLMEDKIYSELLHEVGFLNDSSTTTKTTIHSVPSSMKNLSKLVLLSLSSYKDVDFFPYHPEDTVLQFITNISINVSYERVILPLFALYVMDYVIVFDDLALNKTKLKMRMIKFLCNISIISPSVFFKRFSLETFSPYLGQRQVKGDVLEEFTILEVLTLISAKQDPTQGPKVWEAFINPSCEGEDGQDDLLLLTINHLLSLRFETEEHKVPSYISLITKDGVLPVKQSIITHIMKDSKSLSDNTVNKDKVSPLETLKHFQHIPEYKRSLTEVCSHFLSDVLAKEGAALDHMTKQAEEVKVSDDKNNYEASILGFASSTDTLLDLIDHVITKPACSSNSDGQESIKDFTAIKPRLNKLVIHCMQAFKLITKLQAAGKFLRQDAVNNQLYRVMTIPLRYYIQLSDLKNANIAAILTNSSSRESQTSLTRRLSSLDSFEGLKEPYSAVDPDAAGFSEVLSQWMKKDKEHIMKAYEIYTDAKKDSKKDAKKDKEHIMKDDDEVDTVDNKDSKKDKNDICEQLCTKFPWIISFQAKKQSLMYLLYCCHYR